MKRLVLGALVLSFSMLLSPAIASADVNDFTITNFTADYYLSRNDPQGSLAIDEHLDVAFTDYNHGILRALPERYNGRPQHVHISKVLRDGAPEHYTTSSQNGNLVLKIGNAGNTITGKHRYEIAYSVANVNRIYPSYDALIWNTNGTQWDQPFLAVRATLHLPPELASQLSGADPQCFTGTNGSQQHDCSWSKPDNSTLVFTANRALSPNENLSFEANFQPGTFAKPSAKDWLADYGPRLAVALGLPLLVLGVAAAYWRKNGKDLKGRGTIIPEYTPPAGMGPLEVDTIAHYKLGTKAISATIIDVAIRKYLRIIETDSKKLLGLGTNKNYSLELLQDDLSALNSYEKQIINAVFGGEKKSVDISSLKNKFYSTAQSLQKQLPEDLTTAGYFARNPKRAGNGIHIIGGLLVFGGFYMFGVSWSAAVGIIASGLILFLFASLMSRRTQKGVEAKDAIDGLKLYMEVAEKDRIAMLQSPNAPYAATSAAPEHTVELFEKLLPYAIVLGVEQQWGKKFDGIYTTPPDWYSGNWTAFNTGYLIGSLDSSMGAIGTTFTSPASSGSGSGGSFSGGGGGGGGGGGW